MKRGDLKVGQSYAVSRHQNDSYARERVLDSLDLHMEDHKTYLRQSASQGIVPLPENLKDSRPTIGDKYPYREVGLLMHDPKTPHKQILVQPAHVKMTWETWLLQAAQQERDSKAASLARLEREALRATQAAEITRELDRLALSFHVSTWEDYQKVPNTILLELLRKL